SYALWIIHGPDAAIAQWVGFLLLAILGWYLWISIRWGKHHSRLAASAVHPHTDESPAQVVEHAAHKPWAKLIVLFIAGLVLILIFGRVLIGAVEEGALQAGIPQVVIAATIVA